MASITVRIAGKSKNRVKGKASKSGKAVKAPQSGTKPGARPIGRTTKLGIQGAWCHIFQQNAKQRLCDADITKWMNKEFPGRDSKVFGSVSAVRSKYNAGGLSGGEAPKVRSVSYDENGNPKKPQAAANGKSSVSARKRKTKRAV